MPWRIGSSTPIAGTDSTPMVPVASDRRRFWYSASSWKSASREPSARTTSPICTCWAASRRLYASAALSAVSESVLTAAPACAARAEAVSRPSFSHWFSGGVQTSVSPTTTRSAASSTYARATSRSRRSSRLRRASARPPDTASQNEGRPSVSVLVMEGLPSSVSILPDVMRPVSERVRLATLLGLHGQVRDAAGHGDDDHADHGVAEQAAGLR